MAVFVKPLIIMKDKAVLLKGVKLSSIALPVIIVAPIMITMGFKGIRLDNPLVGWVFLSIGIISAISGMLLLFKGISLLLDYLFQKQ